ncbi:hypothetical protein KAU55_00565 [Candidatus Bathyarchaeota archaeon]|nr:hypothetical protein [Candidatus Bathyarchaeota archaeon]
MVETKKKASEMTFKEFMEETEKQGEDRAAAEIKRELLTVLKKEGFSEEQVNEMKMDRVWKNYLKALGDEFEDMISSLAKSLETGKIHPKALQLFNEKIREITKQLEKLTEEHE